MIPTYIVTGGAGFIGSWFVLHCRKNKIAKIINLDLLTYAGNMDNLKALENDKDHLFVKGDIGNEALVAELLDKYKPQAIVNFAAESHVDRSILDPYAFVKTNVLGTTVLLRESLNYWQSLTKKEDFRFLHVSTDEVFGSLNATEPAFTEETPYSPNSPYSASKAASDHLVRSFKETYGLPILITNCSNNYGPMQFPEKLIPLIILNAISGKKLPLYGKGDNIRDWLHVEDHCLAIATVLEKGVVGETYVIGGHEELTNLEIVHRICKILDEVKPSPNGSYKDAITFVSDRPGHDYRYAIDCTKIESTLGWKPKHDFETGLRDTVSWYLNNQSWVKRILSGEYKNWIDKNYLDR